MSSDFTGHYFCLHIFLDYYYSLVKSRKNNIPFIKFKSIIIAFKIFKAIIFLGIPIKPATRAQPCTAHVAAALTGGQACTSLDICNCL